MLLNNLQDVLAVLGKVLLDVSYLFLVFVDNAPLRRKSILNFLIKALLVFTQFTVDQFYKRLLNFAQIVVQLSSLTTAELVYFSGK